MDSTLDILAHTGDAVCAVNDERRVVYWNAAAEEMSGIAANEAIGQPCWTVIKGKTANGEPFCSPECPIHARIIAQEAIPHFDLWVKNKSGKRTLANFSTITIPQQNGRRRPDQAAVVHLMRVVQNHQFPQCDLRIKLLGPLEVWRANGVQIDGKFWRRAKVRGLFVFLALKQGDPITKEELITALWPKLERSAASRKLNTAVHNLCRSLEPELKKGEQSHYIFNEAGQYWLGSGQPHWIDVDAFRLGVQQARLETAVDQAIHYYEEALALYRGDYLVDLIPTTGIGSKTEQNQLRQLHLSALEELANLYKQQEQIEQARSTYLKILAIDPYRESACRQLANLSRETGSLMDNVAYCQRLAAALKSELDLILSQDIHNHQHPKKENRP